MALFYCQGALWAHVKLTVCQDPQGLFCRTALQSATLKRVVSFQVEVFASAFAEEALRPIAPA